MPPIIRAKTAMASAARVTGLRCGGVGEAEMVESERSGVRDADPENEIDDGSPRRRVDGGR
jgi:hypothetical protein